MLLDGRKAYYWKGKRPESSFISRQHEAALYKLLSNHLHSFPLGTSFRFKGSSTDPLSQLNTAFIVVEALILYSAATIQAFTKFRWKVGKTLNKNDNKYINDLLEQRVLECWLQEISTNNKFLTDDI